MSRTSRRKASRSGAGLETVDETLFSSHTFSDVFPVHGCLSKNTNSRLLGC